MAYKIQALGLYSKTFEAREHAEMMVHVDCLKQRPDVAVIRVTYPSGNIRTLAWEDGKWYGDVF